MLQAMLQVLLLALIFLCLRMFPATRTGWDTDSSGTQETTLYINVVKIKDDVTLLLVLLIPYFTTKEGTTLKRGWSGATG